MAWVAMSTRTSARRARRPASGRMRASASRRNRAPESSRRQGGPLRRPERARRRRPDPHGGALIHMMDVAAGAAGGVWVRGRQPAGPACGDEGDWGCRSAHRRGRDDRPAGRGFRDDALRRGSRRCWRARPSARHGLPRGRCRAARRARERPARRHPARTTGVRADGWLLAEEMAAFGVGLTCKNVDFTCSDTERPPARSVPFCQGTAVGARQMSGGSTPARPRSAHTCGDL